MLLTIITNIIRVGIFLIFCIDWHNTEDYFCRLSRKSNINFWYSGPRRVKKGIFQARYNCIFVFIIVLYALFWVLWVNNIIFTSNVLVWILFVIFGTMRTFLEQSVILTLFGETLKRGPLKSPKIEFKIKFQWSDIISRSLGSMHTENERYRRHEPLMVSIYLNVPC